MRAGSGVGRQKEGARGEIRIRKKGRKKERMKERKNKRRNAERGTQKSKQASKQTNKQTNKQVGKQGLKPWRGGKQNGNGVAIEMAPSFPFGSLKAQKGYGTPKIKQKNNDAPMDVSETQGAL